jgi:FecR protein
MKVSSRRFFFLLGLVGFFLVLAKSALAAKDTYPQIVRLSYVQGDVRLSRGDGKHPDLKKPWEQAQVNTPIEQGFSLATGEGRAEIEFENGATAYLAENSVLIFNQLESEDGLTRTLLTLDTGTATFSVQPTGGDTFVVKISAAEVGFNHPTSARLDKYLDGLAFTPQEEKGEDFQQVGLKTIHLAKGQTITYQNGQPVQLQGVENSNMHAEWDNWVDARMKTREAAIEAGLQASGLPKPIPGLVDLATQGTFFSCEPYGKCWQPNGLASAVKQEPPQAGGTDSPIQSPIVQTPQQKSPEGKRLINPGEKYVSDCPVMLDRTTLVPDPMDPTKQKVRHELISEGWSRPWCYAGSWVHYRGSYAWVVGPARHEPPVHRVCVKKRCGIVPVHPLDVPGKPPINLKYGILLSPSKPSGHPTRLHPKPTDKVEVQSVSMKDYGKTMLPRPTKVEPPTIQAHFVKDKAVSAGGSGGKGSEPMIRYDYKSQKFLQAAVPQAGGKTKTIVVGGLTRRGEFSGSLGGHSFGPGERAWSGSQSGGGSSNSAARGRSTSSGASSGSHSSSGGSSASGRGSSSGSHASGGSSSSSGSSSGGHSSGGGGGGSSSGSSGGHSSGGGGGSSNSGSSSGSGSSGGSTGGGRPR